MKTKTSVLVFSSLLAAFALLAVPARAESNDAPAKSDKTVNAPVKPAKPAKAVKDGAKRPDGDRLGKMREQLDLTDAQVDQLRPIFAAEREEMMAKRKELGKDATPEQKREAAAAVHAKFKPKVDAVLTAEQKAKMGKQRERAGKRAGAPEGAAGPDGPARPSKADKE